MAWTALFCGGACCFPLNIESPGWPAWTYLATFSVRRHKSFPCFCGYTLHHIWPWDGGVRGSLGPAEVTWALLDAGCKGELFTTALSMFPFSLHEKAYPTESIGKEKMVFYAKWYSVVFYTMQEVPELLAKTGATESHLVTSSHVWDLAITIPLQLLTNSAQNRYIQAARLDQNLKDWCLTW